MKRGIELIKEFEGCKLEAYRCSAGVETIGFGNTFYENGVRVKMGDKINKARAEELLIFMVNKFSNDIKKVVKVQLNDNQFGAILSFVWNIGIVAFAKSTLLKKLNSNPNDITIKDEFMKWNKAGGKILNGLTRRREAEQKLYFTNG